MALRLSELHPSFVHVPIAMFPAALVADAIGKVTRHRGLLDVGRWTIGVAAASGVIAGVLGLIAQEEVELDAAGQQVLQTHRTLNLGFIATTLGMAVVRARARAPSLPYLLTGLGAFAVAGVSAYLGGKLVYTHGAGVERRGVAPTDASIPGETGPALRRAVRDVGMGAKHAAEDLKRGVFVPAFRR